MALLTVLGLDPVVELGELVSELVTNFVAGDPNGIAFLVEVTCAYIQVRCGFFKCHPAPVLFFSQRTFSLVVLIEP